MVARTLSALLALLVVAAAAASRAPGRTGSAFLTAAPAGRAPLARAAVQLADVIVGAEQEMLHITEPAMAQLVALKQKEGADKDMVLRMGVRSGGCSGMSYVMDMISADEIDESDLVIEYAEVRSARRGARVLPAADSWTRAPFAPRSRAQEGLRCVIDPKSSMFLYGLQLTYSNELIGGGFGFKVRAPRRGPSRVASRAQQRRGAAPRSTHARARRTPTPRARAAAAARSACDAQRGIPSRQAGFRTPPPGVQRRRRRSANSEIILVLPNGNLMNRTTLPGV